MSEKLTEGQLQEIVDFSQGILAVQGFYSPWMQNQLMNQLNNNPNIPSIDKIKKALSEYTNSAEELQGYVEFMQKWDMIFARTLRSYADILSFDLDFVKELFLDEV